LLADQDSVGSGSVKIDNRKAGAIKNWMERSDEAVLALVEESQHDVPFGFGPWGEQLAMVSWLFMDSTSPTPLSASACSGMEPLDGESSVSIEWSLPLTGGAQHLLFKRIKADFEKSTALVDVRSKNRYRAKEQDLLPVRNSAALWIQIKGLCSATIDVDAFEEKFVAGLVDDELSEVLVQRPKSFAISMLPSQKTTMQKKALEQEQKVCSQVEAQRVEVRHAKFQFFKAALARDQLEISTVEAAPAKISAMQHRIEARWREEQAQKGDQAVKSYCNKFMRVLGVERVDFIVGPLNDFLSFVVPCFFLQFEAGWAPNI